ncbi:hypothetical protein [Novipirellula galeiformis]|nr:hypothetical protein [Novipirellula galeiformis]
MSIVSAIQPASMRDGTAASFPAFLVEASVNSLSQMHTWLNKWQND